ncbi:glycosyl transferase family 1 [Stutzerimonas nosocomialis]|uniref:glycosyltransferase family 4 protein n=1 Tax=Stutzerimonas nosocomialis TaxID=1056496 RepID=UPI00110979CB|nr:glycosyltransferase family 4 protein [Stutzerimonas nosocomialis]TLX59275.1 glycosyl transferase family 1 [Stutzerimonas nosocomialis]
MIKVLHFFKTYCPETMGGIEQVIFQLAEGGAAHGIASEVLYLSPRGAARGETVGHHLAHRSRLDLHLASTGLSLSAIGDFAELAERADIVHYHFPWPFMDVAHFAARIRKPSVVSYHSDVVKQKLLLKLYAPLMHRFLGRVDRIVAASPNYVRTSPVLQRHGERVSVIPYGLDRRTYPVPRPERLDYWRSRLGERFFLFVGALRYYKGLDYLLEAVRGTELTVAVVGTGLEEPRLHEQARQMGLDNLHFLGGLPDEDKAALLTMCQGFVFPSHLRSEAFGISLLEGAMYGKPLISCEIGTGTTFINIGDETGLVVPPRDPVALRLAMLRLQREPEMARRMGANASYRFEQLFRAESMLSAYAALYRELV